MTKKQKMMTVRVTATGREMEVPKGLMGADLERYVETKLQEEAAEAALAEAQAKAAAEQQERQAVEELSLAQQLDAANRRAQAMEEEIKALKRATPEAAHMLLALQQASSQASQTLQALNRWDSRKGAEVSLVAEELAKRNAVIDEEVLERRRQSNQLMDAIRVSQGIEPLHTEGD